MTEKVLKNLFFAVFLPGMLALTVAVFGKKNYAASAAILAVFACVPCFFAFERKEKSAIYMTVLSVMTALSITGRLVFSFIPHFKPVSAMVIITGMYLGSEAGFLCGALTALISNFMFGQGPWTPFQMIAWGLLGFIASLLSRPLSESRILLTLFAVFSGVFYSCFMDVFTTLWAGGGFNFKLYFGMIISAVPVTAIYIVSDAVFLNILARPIGKKISRIIRKYRK